MARGGEQFIPRPETWRLGDPPPWRPEAGIADLDTLVERIRRRTDTSPRTNMPMIRSEAAVLVPLSTTVDGPAVVLTKRSSNMRHHRGEISFPGGRQDPGESLDQTAIREANEEIGLDPSHVSIVGRLRRLGTVTSNASIHPFVATIPHGLGFRASPAEVESVLTVPLEELIQPEVFREERWSDPSTGHERPLWFFELEGETVWGATAAMLFDLLRDAVEGTDDVDSSR